MITAAMFSIMDLLPEGSGSGSGDGGFNDDATNGIVRRWSKMIWLIVTIN